MALANAVGRRRTGRRPSTRFCGMLENECRGGGASYLADTEADFTRFMVVA